MIGMNEQPEKVVNAKSINSFKNQIDKLYANIMYKTNIKG